MKISSNILGLDWIDGITNGLKLRRVDSSVHVLMFEVSNFCLTYLLLLVFVGDEEGDIALKIDSFCFTFNTPTLPPQFF